MIVPVAVNRSPRFTGASARLYSQYEPLWDWLVISTNQRRARLDGTAALDTCAVCLQNAAWSPRAASQSARALSERLYAIGRSWRGGGNPAEALTRTGGSGQQACTRSHGDERERELVVVVGKNTGFVQNLKRFRSACCFSCRCFRCM